MTLTEVLTFGGLFLNTIGMAVVLFKLVWGSAAGHHAQFSILEKAVSEEVRATRNDMLIKLELQSTNIGNVTANISDRIHQLELKAMEFRAIAAETYMRRDSYHKATDDFKRDIKEAHDDLKQEMDARFDEVKEQIGAVSMSIEANRQARRGD